MPFFIKKVCKVNNERGLFCLQPKDLTVDQICFAKAKHKCDNFNIDSIFDLRSYIMTNCVKREINFYLHLLDEHKNVINVNNKEGYSYIYSFNRKPQKRKLNYFPFITKNKLEINNNLIDLGFSSLVTNQMIAYETTSCFSNHFSKNGGGFYGFKISIPIDVQPHFAVLYGYEEKVRNPYLFFNNRIMSLYNDSEESHFSRGSSYLDESSYSEESSYYSEESNDYSVYVSENNNNIGYAMPSAPQQVIEPTAPPYPIN